MYSITTTTVARLHSAVSKASTVLQKLYKNHENVAHCMYVVKVWVSRTFNDSCLDGDPASSYHKFKLPILNVSVMLLR